MGVWQFLEVCSIFWELGPNNLRSPNIFAKLTIFWPNSQFFGQTPNFWEKLLNIGWSLNFLTRLPIAERNSQILAKVLIIMGKLLNIGQSPNFLDQSLKMLARIPKLGNLPKYWRSCKIWAKVPFFSSNLKRLLSKKAQHNFGQKWGSDLTGIGEAHMPRFSQKDLPDRVILKNPC